MLICRCGHTKASHTEPGGSCHLCHCDGFERQKTRLLIDDVVWPWDGDIEPGMRELCELAIVNTRIADSGDIAISSNGDIETMSVVEMKTYLQNAIAERLRGSFPTKEQREASMKALRDFIEANLGEPLTQATATLSDIIADRALAAREQIQASLDEAVIAGATPPTMAPLLDLKTRRVPAAKELTRIEMQTGPIAPIGDDHIDAAVYAWRATNKEGVALRSRQTMTEGSAFHTLSLGLALCGQWRITALSAFRHVQQDCLEVTEVTTILDTPHVDGALTLRELGAIEWAAAVRAGVRALPPPGPVVHCQGDVDIDDHA